MFRRDFVPAAAVNAVNFSLTFQFYLGGMNSIEQRLERLRKRKAVEDAPKLAAEARRVKALAAKALRARVSKERQKAQWGVFWRTCRRKGWPVPKSDLPELQDWSRELLKIEQDKAEVEQRKAEAKAASYTRGPYTKRIPWHAKRYDPARERAEWLEDKAREEAREAAADAKFQQDLRALRERETQRYKAA